MLSCMLESSSLRLLAPCPTTLANPSHTAPCLERLSALISPEPENRAELLEILQDAHERNLIDADSLAMIEGVFQVSDLCARDIMAALADGRHRHHQTV